MTSLPNKKISFFKTRILLSVLKNSFYEKRSRENSSFRAYKRILGGIRSISEKSEKPHQETKTLSGDVVLNVPLGITIYC